ncbi:hypothetical protein K1X12_04730 [Hyphomonas sp. WL0036]|uniref:hypothetical protein n=1 Tax=Hyphomonas sediminis TaxID=2866160 RepID=UPI001C7E9D7C|nr:hypothetical protein [Hyphomonas sediminis]MBY9066191.1 hypothetical protein [Hyphomonas sediminis]
MRLQNLAAGLALLMASACASQVQTTSGTEYLARYDGAYSALAGGSSEVDSQVREIAAVEPDIRFPARIGLARIEGGQLVSIPAREAEAWAALTENLDGLYGEFVPVSPLIAAMVAPEGTKPRYEYTASDTMADIRRGAARQHLDYVLAYEVSTSNRAKGSALSFADLTIIGMFVLPGRSVQAEAAASGILIDVRNGYPYATMTAFADKKGLSRTINTWRVKRDLMRNASAKAVLELAGELRGSLEKLAVAGTSKDVGSGTETQEEGS